MVEKQPKLEAQFDDQGNPVTATIDGKEKVQRKVTLRESDSTPPKKLPGARVRVYNKLRARLFTSDGSLGPEQEGDILESDLDIPGIAENVIKVAD